MRWQQKPYPKEGDERVRRRLLLLPQRIDMEWRWLERAEWLERYVPGYSLDDYDAWVYVRWLN